MGLLEDVTTIILTEGTLSKLSDDEIARLLFHYLWDEVDPLSPKAILIIETITRLSPEAKEALENLE